MAPKAEEPVTVADEEIPPTEMETVSLKEEAPEALATEEETAEAPSEDAEKETGETEDIDASSEPEAKGPVEPMNFTKHLACFDLSTLACCGFGSKGACSQCGVPIMYSEESVQAQEDLGRFSHKSCRDKEEQEELENEKATQIQKLARAKIARDAAEAMKSAKEPRSDEAKPEDAIPDTPAPEAASKAAPDAVPESAPETAPVEAPVKTGKKKNFFQRLSSIFSGCKRSDKQVDESFEIVSNDRTTAA